MIYKPDTPQGSWRNQNTKRQPDFLSSYLKETPGSGPGHLQPPRGHTVGLDHQSLPSEQSHNKWLVSDPSSETTHKKAETLARASETKGGPRLLPKPGQAFQHEARVCVW